MAWGDICPPCGCGTPCPTTTEAFTGGAIGLFGPSLPTGWSVASERLVYSAATESFAPASVPVVDTGVLPTLEVTADLIGNGEITDDSDDGGLRIQPVVGDWAISFRIDGGRLHLRIYAGGEVVRIRSAVAPTDRPLAMSVRAKTTCDVGTRVTASAGSVSLSISRVPIDLLAAIADGLRVVKMGADAPDGEAGTECPETPCCPGICRPGAWVIDQDFPGISGGTLHTSGTLIRDDDLEVWIGDVVWSATDCVPGPDPTTYTWNGATIACTGTNADAYTLTYGNSEAATAGSCGPLTLEFANVESVMLCDGTTSPEPLTLEFTAEAESPTVLPRRWDNFRFKACDGKTPDECPPIPTVEPDFGVSDCITFCSNSVEPPTDPEEDAASMSTEYSVEIPFWGAERFDETDPPFPDGRPVGTWVLAHHSTFHTTVGCSSSCMRWIALCDSSVNPVSGGFDNEVRAGGHCAEDITGLVGIGCPMIELSYQCNPGVWILVVRMSNLEEFHVSYRLEEAWPPDWGATKTLLLHTYYGGSEDAWPPSLTI